MFKIYPYFGLGYDFFLDFFVGSYDNLYSCSYVSRMRNVFLYKVNHKGRNRDDRDVYILWNFLYILFEIICVHSWNISKW